MTFTNSTVSRLPSFNEFKCPCELYNNQIPKTVVKANFLIKVLLSKFKIARFISLMKAYFVNLKIIC